MKFIDIIEPLKNGAVAFDKGWKDTYLYWNRGKRDLYIRRRNLTFGPYHGKIDLKNSGWEIKYLDNSI